MEIQAQGAAVGTLLGQVADGETLAGWEIVATGDGGAITMKSGSCWGRYSGEFDSDTAWDAVTARLWAKLSDEQIAAKVSECRAEVLATQVGTIKRRGAQAALEATYAVMRERIAAAVEIGQEDVARAVFGDGLVDDWFRNEGWDPDAAREEA